MSLPYEPAPLPLNEGERLSALEEYEVMDTSPQAIFDDYTWLASSICETPIALISLVDARRQWFKSRVGLNVDETPREIAFCAHAILNNQIMEVNDALRDERFKGNPLVTAENGIRFYAGTPLTSADGHNVGTLCVIDREPRELSAQQKEALTRLGRQVIKQLETQQMMLERRRTEILRSSILEVLAKLASGHTDPSVFENLITYVEQAAKKCYVSLHLASDPEHMIASGTPHHPESFYQRQAAHVLESLQTGQEIMSVRFEPAYVAIPIMINHKPLGILSLAAKDQRTLEKAQRFLDPLVVALSSLLVSYEKARAHRQLFETQQLQLQALQSLNDIAALPDLDLHAQIEKALHLGCQYYGLDVGVVCAVPPVSVAGPSAMTLFAQNKALSEEEAAEILDFCRERLQPSVFEVPEVKDAPCIVHTLLEIDQTVLGCLHFRSASCERDAFNETDREFTQLLTRWIASTLSRHHIQQERQQNEATLEMTGQIASVGGWEIDLETMTPYWTRQTRRIHEVSDDYQPNLDEAINFYAPEARPIVQAAVAEAIETGKPWDLELPFITAKNNFIWVRAAGSVMLDENGKAVRLFGAFQDITERKQGERIKEEFISTMNHELRTPLTSVAGALSMLSKKELDPENQKKLLDIASKNTTRLTQLINDLLDIEKIAAGAMRFQMKPLEVNALVEEILHQQETFVSGFGSRFDFTAAQQLVYCELDALRFTQVMNNLLSNAAKFSPQNSQIDVRVYRENRQICVAVTNPGEMLNESFKVQIFQRFVQGDSSDTRHRGGAGLGLAISQELTEAMKGEIHVFSEDGKNTFIICFPEIKAREVITETSVKKKLTPPKKYNTRILMVEDDPDLFDIVHGQCQSMAHFDHAITLAKAREKLANSVYDLVLLDVGMPDGSGFELVAEIKELAFVPELVVFSAKELTVSQRNMVDEALVKSRSTPEDFVEWLQERLLGRDARKNDEHESSLTNRAEDTP